MAAITAWMLVALPRTQAAQETPYSGTSPLRLCCTMRMEELRDTLPSLSSVTRNVATFRTALPDDWRRLAFVARREGGALRRPQEAMDVEQADLLAEGVRHHAAWTTAGGVRYLRGTEHDVAWRNGSDAYLGNSYIWADSAGGTWRRDQVALDATIVSPLWRGLNGGMHLDYGIGQGARRNDPRPLFRRRVIEIAPGIAWRIGRHAVGATAIAGWHREDLEIGGASVDDPVVFRLRGMSTFDRTQLISAERAIIGGVTGGSAGYAWSGERWLMAAGSTIRLEHDRVRDGVGTPTDGGSTRRQRIDGKAQVRRVGAASSFELGVHGRREQANGRDPVFAALNQIDVGRVVEARASWWTGADVRRAAWRIESTLATQQVHRRDIAAESRWIVERDAVSLTAWHRFGHGINRAVLGAGAAVPIRSNGTYEAFAATRMTPVLAYADFTVAETAPGQAMASVTWEHARPNDTLVRLHLAFRSQHRTVLRDAVSSALHRYTWTLALELL